MDTSRYIGRTPSAEPCFIGCSICALYDFPMALQQIADTHSIRGCPYPLPSPKNHEPLPLGGTDGALGDLLKKTKADERTIIALRQQVALLKQQLRECQPTQPEANQRGSDL